GAASVHEKEAEYFYVIDGSATLVTGGKLVNEKRTNAENLTGTAIEGGMTRNIAKGDFIVVPENTPHWFSPINGTLVLMSMHVPRPVPEAK
ncbi:MAG TPA: cupin domain-containing protein, partial [Bryobacteraceae bacterium]|nr:cupin domain-containing protein [Bryobacteraceae bacterium]